jgi:8-oxo-dGTP pyrophosphatase MutT (NUDIX family)
MRASMRICVFAMILRWKPNVTVAAVVERDARFLLVEEETADGLRFNQPAGHLEEGESLLAATARETLEETAHPFVPEYLVGIYQWARPQGDVTYLRFAFGGQAGDAETGRSLDDGILRAVWMTLDELRATQARHRSRLVLQCVEDYLAGRRYGLELLRHYD